MAFLFITISSIIASRLNYSSIPFLIIAGMLVGPHAPAGQNFSMHLVTPGEPLELLARLGVLLMLFYLGLEFSAGKMATAGKTLLKGGTLYVGLNFARGLILGWIMFGAWREALVIAGITCISSSAIITKLLVELKRTANPETELILGIMVFEDVFIAVYLSVLSAVLITGSVNILALLPGILTIICLIVAVILFGPSLAKRLEPLLRLRTTECFTVAVFTLLLLVSAGVEKIHVAEAIGALLLGLVLAETTHNKKVIQVITPMRDLFGAVFFFVFGMGIDYRLFGEVLTLALLAAAVTVVGNLAAGLLAAWLSGYRARRAFNVAFTIIARGEFSVILASIAAAAGASGLLPSIAALYVLILAFISPALAKNAKKFYELYQGLRVLLVKKIARNSTAG